jgi:hypothetical protein
MSFTRLLTVILLSKQGFCRLRLCGDASSSSEAAVRREKSQGTDLCWKKKVVESDIVFIYEKEYDSCKSTEYRSSLEVLIYG